MCLQGHPVDIDIMGHPAVIDNVALSVTNHTKKHFCPIISLLWWLFLSVHKGWKLRFSEAYKSFYMVLKLNDNVPLLSFSFKVLTYKCTTAIDGTIYNI